VDEVKLRPMTDDEYQAWLPRAVADYAEEHIASGRWPKDEGLETSRREFERLLPDGPRTANQHLWSVVRAEDGQVVGRLWVAIVDQPSRHAFVYNLEIDEAFRRRGYGEAAMRAAEEEARGMGVDTIRLHVCGHNTRARPLYEKLGYEPTNIVMAKRLS
jgi:ribosomal protein S18 acetylase RimI-like enzyme